MVAPDRASSSTQQNHEHKARPPAVLIRVCVEQAKPEIVTRFSCKFQGSKKPQTPVLSLASRTNVCFRNKDSWNNLGWKGPQEVYSPTSCSKQGQLQDRIGLYVTLSSQVLTSPKDGGSTTSLGILLHCLTVLVLKKSDIFSCTQLDQVLLIQFMPAVPHPPTTDHCEEVGSTFSITSLKVGAGCYEVFRTISSLG